MENTPETCLHDATRDRTGSEAMPANLSSSPDPDPGSGAPPDGGPGPLGAPHDWPALLFGVLLIVVTVCGNVLVCVSVHMEKALKTTTNYFIVSLAVADLMLAVLVLPLFVYSEVSETRPRTEDV